MSPNYSLSLSLSATEKNRLIELCVHDSVAKVHRYFLLSKHVTDRIQTAGNNRMVNPKVAVLTNLLFNTMIHVYRLHKLYISFYP